MQVKGKENALKLIESLQPSVVIPLINAQFHQSGPLSKLIHAEGSPEDLQGLLQHNGLQHVRVRMPAAPGKSFAVTLWLIGYSHEASLCHFPLYTFE